MEAGVDPDMKARKRTEGAAVDRVKNGDSVSARIDDGPTCLTSFGMIAEPLLKAPEKCIGDALVNKGTQAPKPQFSPMEDTHAIIRRQWLNARRHWHHINNEDHCPPTAFFLEPQ